MKSMI